MLNRRSFIASGLTAGAALSTGVMPAFANTSMTVSEAIRTAMYAPLYVAGHLGLYKKHGLDVDVQTAGGIALPIPMILSGRSLVGVTSPGMSVNATREGASIKNIAKIVGGVSMWAIAKPGSGISKIEDLKGKTIATLKFPSSTIQVPTYAIKKALGMTPEEAGITFLELPPGAQATAVKDGRADVATAFEWDVSVGSRDFGLETVLSLADVIGPTSFTTAQATEEAIAEHQEEIQAFCNAMAEAMTAMHADHSLLAATGAEYFPQVDQDIIESAAANFFASGVAIPTTPVISEDEFASAMSLELGGGSISEALPFEQMVDNRFAEAAAAKYGA
ncbi:ABC transporter substrate-binding protein [Celeribacter halophilus]|uniref:Thiamine pyrimidine synthase n=1 Tax=Celeribacter halophilus TaxID=576117 RepID=A0AAW7XWW5_9RHOB|nr:ABC transporter substrate-binding protein [Celeribacter halophilus]MDO6458562.1 ABC transporter substrate-binding protein [Celeribacter halophilus]